MSSILQRLSLSTLASSIKNNSNNNNNNNNNTSNNNTKQKYSKEEIESAISEIKQLGKHAMEQQNETNNINPNQASINSITSIKKILKLMKQYNNNLYIQRVACHALSNLAMQVVIARYIVNNNGFQYIRNALEKFINDHKLCWLASSALWNMARPPANRDIIGKNGVKLMLKVLSIHYIKHEKVTNTAIGALSNLSLCESIKAIICKKDNIELILKVLNLYSKSDSDSNTQQQSISVMTSGAGLLANLAVSDDHAATLLQYNSLPTLIQLLHWRVPGSSDDDSKNNEEEQERNNSVENTLHRNTCAALNNMVTAKHFIDKILECNGIETIYTFIKHTKNELFVNLLENCLTTLECDNKHPTTTMHLCAAHNRIDLIKKMITKSSTVDNDNDSSDAMDIDDNNSDIIENNDISDLISVGSHIWGINKSKYFTTTELLNQTDGNNMTCLQYAALNKHYELIELLVKSGANSDGLLQYSSNNFKNNDSNENTEDSDNNNSNDEKLIEEHQNNIQNAINNAKLTVKSISKQHSDALIDVLDDFPTDLCKFIVTFKDDIDMLQIANKF